MTNPRTVAACAVAIVCLTAGLDGQDLSHYRSFALESNLADVSALAGVPPSEAKTVHERPALLQDLEWRPSRWIAGSTTPSTDPVEQIVFSFYNDQLFRVVVDYGRERTEGMTGADMVEAISQAYGAPTAPRTSRPAAAATPRADSEFGSPIARWMDADRTVSLYQASSYRSSFRLVMSQTRLNQAARTAEDQALRLDDREASGKEIARQKKEREDEQAAGEKARSANKGDFRP